MEKIIRGKRYNTETATEVCQNWNGKSVNDFEHMFEVLHVKRSGEFFLHYGGGPLSKYAVIDGCNTSGAEGIKPLTEAQAQDFCEKYGDAKTYEKYFTIIEDDDTVQICVRLTAANEKKIKKIAVERRVTLSKLFNDIIEQL